MKQDEIFKKAIEKAKANGWEIGNEWPKFEIILAGVGFWEGPEPHYAHIQDLIGSSPHVAFSVQEIIYSHSFAKAFWGEETITYLPLNFTKEKDMTKFDWQDYELKLPAWEYHLKLMVVEKNPIKYLEQFI